jgi:hypothetical protein
VLLPNLGNFLKKKKKKKREAWKSGMNLAKPSCVRMGEETTFQYQDALAPQFDINKVHLGPLQKTWAPDSCSPELLRTFQPRAMS